MQGSGHGVIRGGGKAAWVAAVLAVLSLQAAHAQSRAEPPVKYYGAGHIGQNTLSDWPASVNFGGATVTGGLKLDRGLHFGLLAGRQKDDTRLEVEYQAGRVNIEGLTLGAVNQAANARGRYQALTFNALRTFEMSNKVNGFIGLGLGFGSVSLPTLGPVSGCNCFPSTSDSGFVWQARLGAEYEVATDQQLFAQYTYLRLPSNSSGGSPSVSYSSKGVNALSVGFRSGF